MDIVIIDCWELASSRFQLRVDIRSPGSRGDAWFEHVIHHLQPQ